MQIVLNSLCFDLNFLFPCILISLSLSALLCLSAIITAHENPNQHCHPPLTLRLNSITSFPCRFYIGCDVCQDWFHGTCVGITQAEADYIDNYVCPRCSSVNAGERIENKALSQKDIEGLKRLLRSLQVCEILAFDW